MKKSVNNKIWRKHEINEYDVSEITRRLKISDLLARIISARIETLEDAEYFLSPKIKYQLPDPFHLIDMQVAVSRTIEAMTTNQRICIFADYDVDGATSSALLKNVFKDLDVEVDIYVPDRIAEGYGPTIGAMKKIRERGTKLLITVDCGSMAHEAIKHANDLGLDVIVIDHHISTDSMPEAVAIVNPNRLDESSEYTYLAAVGVSFLFAVALVIELRKIDYFKIRQAPNLMNCLDLVALGTVCDVMPIIKLNRAFVATGLKVMARRQNIGIKALCDIAAVQESLSCYHLGFVLGPRINAGGRVGKSSLGACMLSSSCEREVAEVAIELEQHNNERKVIESLILEEAIKMAESQLDNSSLFIIGEGWHPGVIGIIAGKLKEQFNKPVAVVSLNEGIGKASCRSVRGLDFGKKIITAQSSGLVVSGGGHSMAAGFTIMQDKLIALSEFLNNSFEQDLLSSDAHTMEKYDAELTTSAVTLDFIEELEKLQPYGHGNSEPIFKFSDLFVLRADVVGSNHIRLMFAPNRDAYGSKPLNAIAFNAMNSPIKDIVFSKKSHTLSVIGSLKINNWQDRKQIQLHVRDIIV